MKYIVMECFFSFAVVMDQNGAFFKVANPGYEIGQRVDRVEMMELPKAPPKRRPLRTVLITAMSIVLVFTLLLQLGAFRWNRAAVDHYFVRYSYNELIEHSTLVVRGKVCRRTDTLVVASKYGGDDGIFTQYYLDISHVLRGEAAVGDKIAVRVEGGVTPFAELECSDQPKIEAGQEVIAFLYRADAVDGVYTTEEAYYGIVGQGWYHMAENADQSDPVFICYDGESSLTWRETRDDIAGFTEAHPVEETAPQPQEYATVKRRYISFF